MAATFESERVVLNVGGTRYETCVTTLAAYPETLLGAMFAKRNAKFRAPDKAGEYFFDRDSRPFPGILNFHRCGKLHMPVGVTPEEMAEEVSFFQLPREEESCCSVYIWGRGETGQLGAGDRRGTWEPTPIEALRGIAVAGIALGTGHSVCLAQDGRVFTFGYGGDGRLGHGGERDELIPRVVAALDGKRVVQVVCGELHSAAVTASGELYTWGLGKDGRLGHGVRDSCAVPTRVAALVGRSVKAAACGGLHTLALLNDGRVTSWGLGTAGRLGHGDEMDRTAPTEVEALRPHTVVQVNCGGHHSAVLSGARKALFPLTVAYALFCGLGDGTLYTFGFDDDGRLGHGTPGHQFVPRAVDALHGYRIKQVACGCWHSAALSDEGIVFSWGSCKSGQLGHGTKVSCPAPKVVVHGKGGGVTQIACGTAHTACVTANGDVYTWGKADDYRLGYDGGADMVVPKLVERLEGVRAFHVACGVFHTAVLTGTSTL